MNKIEGVNRGEVYKWVVDKLSEYKNTQMLSCELKRYKPAKTQKQLGLFFVCLDFYCERAGYFTESERFWLRKGIEQTYSYKKGTGVYVDGVEQRVGIPLSECNRWEQFEQFYDGIFMMAADHVPSIDMSGFIEQYNKLKEQMREHETSKNK